MVNNVYVSAYFNRNLGDDLFVHLLINRYPNINFCIYGAPKSIKIFSAYPNVKITSTLKWYTSRLLHKARIIKKPSVDNKLLQECGAVIKIGGSIFIEYDKWLNNWVEFNKPLFIIGANYGPARTEQFHQLIKDKISAAYSCCFRDSYSYDQFCELKNVRYAPDVLFGFDPYNYITRCERPKGLAISVINLSNRSLYKDVSDQYYQTVARIVKHHSEKKIPVTLLSFCCNEGDSEAISNVLRMINNKNINVVEYRDDFIPMLEAIEKCETIIATRFHAMILGWIMNKKVIPIIYSQKQTHVINDIAYKGPVFQIEEIGQNTEQIIEACNSILPTVDHLKELKTMSFKQFAEFDEYAMKEVVHL